MTKPLIPADPFAAHQAARSCSEYLLGHYHRTSNEAPRESAWSKEAFTEFRNLARLMGFDLVERLTPQEAHEAMLAARRAEDVEPPVSRIVPRQVDADDREFEYGFR